jgi:hypothetical protein
MVSVSDILLSASQRLSGRYIRVREQVIIEMPFSFRLIEPTLQLGSLSRLYNVVALAL